MHTAQQSSPAQLLDFPIPSLILPFNRNFAFPIGIVHPVIPISDHPRFALCIIIAETSLKLVYQLGKMYLLIFHHPDKEGLREKYIAY